MDHDHGKGKVEALPRALRSGVRIGVCSPCPRPSRAALSQAGEEACRTGCSMPTIWSRCAIMSRTRASISSISIRRSIRTPVTTSSSAHPPAMPPKARSRRSRTAGTGTTRPRTPSSRCCAPAGAAGCSSAMASEIDCGTVRAAAHESPHQTRPHLNSPLLFRLNPCTRDVRPCMAAPLRSSPNGCFSLPSTVSNCAIVIANCRGAATWPLRSAPQISSRQRVGVSYGLPAGGDSLRRPPIMPPSIAAIAECPGLGLKTSGSPDPAAGGAAPPHSSRSAHISCLHKSRILSIHPMLCKQFRRVVVGFRQLGGEPGCRPVRSGKCPNRAKFGKWE